jgi:hypothetical protein
MRSGEKDRRRDERSRAGRPLRRGRSWKGYRSAPTTRTRE